MKDYSDLVRYLKKNSIEPKEAMDIYKRAITINPKNYRTQWKMFRFSMYLWARVEENKKGRLDKKINTIKKIVATERYKKWFTSLIGGGFDHKKEVDKLNKLVSDPRQYPFFKSHNFYYEHTKTNIPQDIIDKIR